MDEDKSNSPASKPSSDSHIPPPTDPYVTYQTPYPRKPSEEIQNPFIEFRRLTDSAFSSFFSGLPRFLGTDKFKDANIKESDQEFVKFFDQQAKEFENRIAEMVRARAEEAEGFKKQMEQELEERRRENEKRKEDERVERKDRSDTTATDLGHARGSRHVGVETRREAETELDLYDGLKAYGSSFYEPHAETAARAAEKCPWKDDKIDKRCPWNDGDREHKSWLPGLGWDGMRRAKNIPLFAPKSRGDHDKRDRNVDWEEYNDQEMDPFTNDDHLVPWLRLSPYSPLSLIGSQDGNDDHLPVRMTRHAREVLSGMPWDEAFEDLIAVQSTGAMPDPRKRRLVYWGGPNQWMTDMAIRGSLGQKWEEGFMVAALMNAVKGNRWKGFDGLKEECKQLTGHEFIHSAYASPFEQAEDDNMEDEAEDADVTLEDWVELVREAFRPRAWEALEQMEELTESIFGDRRSPERTFGARGMSWPSPEEVINALSKSEDESHKIEESGVEQLSNTEDIAQPQPQSWSSSSVSTSSWQSLDEAKPSSLVSTLTTTTTRTLPDGSTETTKTLKKRFSDGREENTESVETKPCEAPRVMDASMQTSDNMRTKRSENGSGWFWN